MLYLRWDETSVWAARPGLMLDRSWKLNLRRNFLGLDVFKGFIQLSDNLEHCEFLS